MRIHAAILIDNPKMLIEENTLSFLIWRNAMVKLDLSISINVMFKENSLLNTTPGLKKRMVFQINLRLAFFSPNIFSSRWNLGWGRLQFLHINDPGRTTSESENQMTLLPSSSVYSLRKLLTGFVRAARIVCALIVISAIDKIDKAATKKTQGSTETR